MIHTIKHLAYQLRTRPEDLDFVFANAERFYYEKKEVKTKDGFPQEKNGKRQYRYLYPSISKLKDIQSKIQRYLLSQLNIPAYAFGSIGGRDNIANAKHHFGNKYFFTTDLKQFFPTITNKMVFDMFRYYQFSPTVARALTRLTTYKGQLPQGAPTSPTIANLVFVKTGLKLQEFADRNSLTFTTYLDDITLSSRSDFKQTTSFILQTIKEGGYKISHGKTNYKTGNIVVTGIQFNNQKLDVTDKYKKKLKMKKGFSLSQIKAHHQYAERVWQANNTLHNKG